jgi:threonyl-tRNA synthetase
MRVPYMLVIGEKEVAEGKVAIRRQGKGDMGSERIEDFVSRLKGEIKERRAD